MEHTRLRKPLFGQRKTSTIRCRESSNGMSIRHDLIQMLWTRSALTVRVQVSASARARGVAAFVERA
jgi:hypothetical protein